MKLNPFLFILLVVSAGANVYFWQLYKGEIALTRLAEEMKETTSSVKSPAALSTPTPNIDKTQPTYAVSPVVVYSPSGLFDDAEKSEITTKYTAPFTDWNRDNSINTLTIHIEKPYPAIVGYSYKITYINADGSNGGFLFGQNKPLEWWLPECMGPSGCVFTENFKSKYPQIVSQLSN